MARPPYTELYFGMTDSRNEANEDRDAFVRSYVDLYGASQAVIDGKKFMVFGPKGTGKSALAWYLQAAEADGGHIATVRDASTLPLAEIPRLQTGQAPGPERTVVAWKFILLCNYLELLLRDQSCSLQWDREVMRVSKLLRNFGFMGDASGRALLSAATTTMMIPVPKLGAIYKRESRAELNIYNLIPYIEGWVSEASSDMRHLLLVDGLDSIYLNDVRYDESLASLVQAAYSINQRLSERGATGSVVLLLRNDVFARVALSLPDSQKMRDDLYRPRLARPFRSGGRQCAAHAASKHKGGPRSREGYRRPQLLPKRDCGRFIRPQDYYFSLSAEYDASHPTRPAAPIRRS